MIHPCSEHNWIDGVMHRPCPWCRIKNLEALIKSYQTDGKKILADQRADFEAEVKRLRETKERLEAGIRWALGEEGDFPPIEKPFFYGWRTELRVRTGMVIDPDLGKSKTLNQTGEGE